MLYCAHHQTRIFEFTQIAADAERAGLVREGGDVLKDLLGERAAARGGVEDNYLSYLLEFLILGERLGRCGKEKYICSAFSELEGNACPYASGPASYDCGFVFEWEIRSWSVV